MDTGAWRAIVLGVAELVSTEGLTLSLSFFFFKDGQRIGRERAAAVKESLKYYLDQSSLTSALLTFWAGPLCGGVCPAPCRAVSCSPGLHPLDGSSTFTYIRGVMT